MLKLFTNLSNGTITVELKVVVTENGEEFLCSSVTVVIVVATTATTHIVMVSRSRQQQIFMGFLEQASLSILPVIM